MSYFQTKVSFLRQQNDGTIKKETEQYLVDAMSFTETEARVIREVGESVRELYFDSIAHSPIQEVVSYGDTDLWFKCKVVYRTMDETTEKEKKTTLYILVNANDVNEAYERCGEHLKGMLVPFEIPKVEETAICDIYQYEKPAPAGYEKLDDMVLEIVQKPNTLEPMWSESRENAKLFHGDNYKSEVAAAILSIQYEMERYDLSSPFKAVQSIQQRNGFSAVEEMTMFAAAADMIDPPKAG